MSHECEARYPAASARPAGDLESDGYVWDRRSAVVARLLLMLGFLDV